MKAWVLGLAGALTLAACGSSGNSPDNHGKLDAAAVALATKLGCTNAVPADGAASAPGAAYIPNCNATPPPSEADTSASVSYLVAVWPTDVLRNAWMQGAKTLGGSYVIGRTPEGYLWVVQTATPDEAQSVAQVLGGTLA